MTVANKNIIDSYTRLFEGLDIVTKRKLIERLSESIGNSDTVRENAFYNAFGAFSDEKPAEQINEEIKSSRTFRAKDLDF